MEKITKEYCEGKILLFYPKTEAEAEFIQRSLFALGFDWSGKTDKKSILLKESAEAGLVLNSRGSLAYNPNSNSIQNGITCTSAQFAPPFTGDPVPTVNKPAIVTINDEAAQKAFLAKLKALKPRITLVRGTQNDTSSHAKPAATALVPPPPLPLIEEKADSVLPDPELLQALFNEVAELKKENTTLKTENTQLRAFMKQMRIRVDVPKL